MTTAATTMRRREMLGTSQMRLSWLTRSRAGARVTARVRPEGSAR
jgi:hypothetical protein